ncbi:ATP-dependent DNA helicase [Nicoliella spurrieriana]|uniref:ATP-dependent DNA helicase n=1 Tax=Nicoliella spurrieriana TaxID=2925830 RepID=A0A976RR22_9LACO|nr:ATP-dependent DNA helicase [Nicoliella spurrieriana]UQS86269.1 ATP-dependent DNA helicase [Nicoliella spurrieriana]
MPTVKIGVRDLIKFTLRSGDLNARLNSQNTGQQGAKIHRKLQNQHGTGYQAEQFLEQLVTINNNQYLVNGRADGIIMDEEPVIEEIKTSDVEFNDLPDSILTLYWGQVSIYAHLLMNTDESIEQVKMQLTYVQTPEQRITKQIREIKRDEAQAFFTHVIDEYREWLVLREQLTHQRVASAKQLAFPFAEFRTGQRDFAAVVYKTIAFKKHLFAEAPTGTGKTISTLFPTIKAMGEQLIDRCFYLTAKQSTRRVAEDAMAIMGEQGLRAKSITLTAKEQITFAAERDLAAEQNPYMIGYYDRLKPALKDILNHHDQITRSTIEEYAEQYQIDPFEFSLDLSEFCDVIIGDYNYLFDPQVHLARFFTVPDDRNCFLVDEAHNLVSRSREMYSTAISNYGLTDMIDQLKKEPVKNEAIIRPLRTIKNSFAHYYRLLGKEQVETMVFETPLTNIVQHLSDAALAIHRWLPKQADNDTTKRVVEFYLTCLNYLKINDRYDPKIYRTRLIRRGLTITFRQFCMDPSEFIAETLACGGSTIFFSATLSPIDYYRRVLGDEDDSLAYQLASPFPPANQLILTANTIHTTYHQRQASIPKIHDAIMAMVRAKPGHYLFFFPSFKYMERVREFFETNDREQKLIVQTRDMTVEQREQYLAAFRNHDQSMVIGFAILGGIFAEGIDLSGDQLIGVGIVSVGLPGLNEETNLVRDYFDAENGNGFTYAYQLPGWNHVVQAAGRLIRTASDQGIVTLMDSRFNQARYRQLFPTNWQLTQTVGTAQQLNQRANQFWHHQLK